MCHRMRRIVSAVALLLCSTGMVPVASADQVTFRYESTTTVDRQTGETQPVVVVLTFDSALPNGTGAFAISPTNGSYGPWSGTLTIGTDTVAIAGGTIEVFNNAGSGSPEDGYDFRWQRARQGTSTTGTLLGEPLCAFRVLLVDEAATMLSSTSLPLDPTFASGTDFIQDDYSVAAAADCSGFGSGTSFGNSEFPGSATRAFSLIRVTTPGIPASYTVMDLGPAAAIVWPSSINNRGDVVGMFWPNGQIQTEPGRAFLYRAGTFYDLGPWFGEHSSAVSINDRGDIVGRWTDVLGRTRGFLLAGGTAVDLGLITPIDLNNLGQVLFKESVNFAIRNPDGSRLNLGGFGNATRLNDFGEVIGTGVDVPQSGVIRYRTGQTVDIAGFFPSAINNTPEVVGGQFLLAGSQFFALPQLQGAIFHGNTINNNGLIAGSAQLGPNGRAAVSDGSVTVDVNDRVSGTSSLATLTTVVDLNDARQMIGFGYTTTGQQRGYLLNPLPAVQPDCGVNVRPQLETMQWEFSIPDSVLHLRVVGLKNLGPAMTGTVSYVMDGLTNALYLGQHHVTACFSGTGDPVISVPVGSDNAFTTGETVVMYLLFAKKSFLAPHYIERFLSGSPVMVR
jgi:probable HAF family extracellular repeat protein